MFPEHFMSIATSMHFDDHAFPYVQSIFFLSSIFDLLPLEFAFGIFFFFSIL